MDLPHAQKDESSQLCSRISLCCCRSIDDVPEDLVIDILGRLPVKSLIRFKCVSRRFSNIITSPKFISMHLTNSKSRKRIRSVACSGVTVNSDKWMAGEEREPDYPYDFLALHVDDNISYMSPFGAFITTINYKAPYGADAGTPDVVSIDAGIDDVYTPFSIVGYCDGIFCLSWRHLTRDCHIYTHYGRYGHTVIALCNPAIREVRVLPMSHSDFPPYHARAWSPDVGFGFDPKTNDYKVVKMVTLEKRGGEYGLDIIEVYSMRSNTWRMVITGGDDDKYGAVQKNIMTCAFHTGMYTANADGGALHWNMWTKHSEGYYYGKENLVVSYLMDDDSVRVTRLPSKYYALFEEHGRLEECYSVIDMKPTLICSYTVDDNSSMCIKVFVMDSYGVDGEDHSNCWRVAYCVKELPYLGCKLIGLWSDDVLVMFDKREEDPFLLDMTTKKRMNLQQLTREMDFFYTETLVSVKLPPP